MRTALQLTGTEQFFSDSEIIVSKTDLGGRITYANDVFLRISGYSEDEVLQQPHSLLRHPDMPRSIFKLMWDTLQSGSEIFAYVVNRCKNGDHYWVLAHVTPTFDTGGKITGYHSNRRVAQKSAIASITDIYRSLAAEERKSGQTKEGMLAASKLLDDMLTRKNTTYGELVFSLEKAAR